jgi:ankyrin repeat protein
MMDVDSRGEALVAAIRSGDTGVLGRLLDEEPGLASSAIGGAYGNRTPLHVVADWPGYFPNGPEVVQILIGAGADPNARNPGKQFAETPLHWAASSDDVDVAAALINGGADVEAPDGSIGTPLDNAIGYACWHVARLLVARGAMVGKLWHAAALGMLSRVQELLTKRPTPEAHDISQAFWHACDAGERRAAELLYGHGADLNWIPDYAKTTALDAANSLGTRRQNVVRWLRELGATSTDSE